ncbi:hypothetical protein BC936DRAFT_147946 [Jimgerdemannia flammicorona]|uniref:Uncharacterized protein n=2 Tax=Jimgerdemannia flammicorona TaxID=994334 RepID=A0A433DKQ9_9FUNG|nr:hypothetical protein BC936DRAFT_147946 [Jimgerdemannia flammicorona]RUS28948.1 hypothetical protein BC938DRAFT_481244 [Jimgerdemannia flammicorona]
MPVNKDDLNVGDHVEYHPVGQATQLSTGVIDEIVTDKQVGMVSRFEGRKVHPSIPFPQHPAGDTGVTVQASDEEPRFVIKNDNTGKSAAYKLANIKRKI